MGKNQKKTFAGNDHDTDVEKGSHQNVRYLILFTSSGNSKGLHHQHSNPIAPCAVLLLVFLNQFLSLTES